MSDIVPFGKYKGKPIEEVAADKQYSEWLVQQEWFRERFARLFSLISAAHAPQETPEHNQMQAMFLDYRFALRFLRKAILTFDDDMKELVTIHPAFMETRLFAVAFEVDGADVEIRVVNGMRLRIELKPKMGDDYPVVLRQVVASKCSVVLIGNYHGRGASYEQVQEIFGSQRVTLLTEFEI